MAGEEQEAADETEALRAEVRRLKQEKERLYATVKCDQIQEEVLTKFQQALQPIHEGVAAGSYTEGSSLEEDLRSAFGSHLGEYDRRTASFCADAIASQKRDLLQTMTAMARRITIVAVEGQLESTLAYRTDETLLSVATGDLPVGSLWPQLRKVLAEVSEAAVEDTKEQLQRLGCAPEHARPEQQQVQELRAASRYAVVKKLGPTEHFLPELLRRAFDTLFRYDGKTGTPRVTGPFTDLESVWSDAMGRVEEILDAFAVRIESVLPPPGEEPSSEQATSPAENPPLLVDALARDRLRREVLSHAEDLFEAQKTKQMLVRGTSDLPLWGLAFILWFGGDHFLALLFQPLRLALAVAICIAATAALMLHKTGLAPKPLAAVLDRLVPVLTMGVFSGMNWTAFFKNSRHAYGKVSGEPDVELGEATAARLPNDSDAQIRGRKTG